MSAMPQLPTTCPKCGTSTTENFNRAERKGLHCAGDNTTKWRTNCGVIVCTCGAHYHRFTEPRTGIKP